MSNWINFPEIAITTAILWIIAGVLFSLSRKRKVIHALRTVFLLAGILLIGGFITYLWIEMERPPMRTLGETRLWYAFFLPIVGHVTYLRWRYNWFLNYSLALALLFLFINYTSPETYSKTLMPALQSPWFVPHVIVYIFSYALLAASSLVAIKGLYDRYRSRFDVGTLKLADNLVYIGFAFLTFGLLFGALWAKEAWGHYWTWDPKETWAFLTWISYLIYMHYRYYNPKKYKTLLWILGLAFVVLLIAWLGLNYLPTGQNSVHTYSS